MIYTVTFNPALDYVLSVENLDSKDINRANEDNINYGGKGINVSIILTRLGVDNKALGFLAGFSGKYIEEELSKDGICSDFIFLKNGYTRINVKIRAQKEIDINAQGPDIDADAVSALFEKLGALESGDYLVLAGSVAKSLPDDIYERILEKLDGRGINFVVDATGNLLKNVLKYKPFMIKPNHHELGDMFSQEVEDLDDIIEYSKRLQSMGARNVLVSRGKEGAVLLDEHGTVHTMGNVPGKITSSVGCGDSMVAGFIAGYEQSGDYSYALKLGSACGNATAFSTDLATKEEIEKMLDNEYLK